MKNASLKEIAIKLREEGYSYGLILEQVPVSKSTLSVWLAHIPYTPNKKVVERIGSALAASGLVKHKQKTASYKEAEMLAKSDIGSCTERDLFMLGIALYIGEGEKNDNVGIINSDPLIIVMTMNWLKKFYNVPQVNFTLAIHLYPDNNSEASLEYWSKQTGIPVSSFGKTQVDRRQNKSMGKRSKLPHGTAHLRVRANGNRQLGALLARRIKAASTIVLEQTNKMRV
jgi:hypothetical protein